MDNPNYENYSFIGDNSLRTPNEYDTTINSNLPETMDVGLVKAPSLRTVEDIRRDSAYMFESSNKTSAIDSLVGKLNSKIDLTGDFVDINATHDKLNSGEYVAKYDTYIHGTDNEARLAKTQSAFTQTINPLLKATTKVTRGIPLDIASFVYGVGDAITSARFANLYDNNFAKWVDDIDKRTDNAYTNYYTEQQKSLLNPLYTWDKFVGGAEFTLRMLGSEALIAYASGGTSLAGTLAKYSLRGLAKAGKVDDLMRVVGSIAKDSAKNTKVLGKMLEPVRASARVGAKTPPFVNTVSSAQDAMNVANQGVKIKDMLKTARFTLTGAAYEAGFEARHFQNEAEQAFWTHHRNNGTTPTTEEMDKFYDRLDTSANLVFGANMALLSVSNLAIYGKMMGIKRPFGKALDKASDKLGAKFFGQGVTKASADGTVEAIKASGKQKVLGYTTPILFNALTEGVYEEGGQGIASNSFKNYVESLYDPTAMNETNTYLKSFTKAFGDQFTTKEGIEEMVIGSLIGGVFGGVSSVKETNRNYKKQETIAQVDTYINQNKDLLYTDKNLAHIFANAGRTTTLNAQLEKALADGKITESSLGQAKMFISQLETAYAVGKSDDMIKLMTDELQGADKALVAQTLGIDENLVDEFKSTQIQGVNDILETYKVSREFATNMFNGKIKGEEFDSNKLISGFSFAMTMGKVAEQTASNLFDGVKQNIIDYFGTGELSQGATIYEALAFTSDANVRILNDLSKTISEKRAQKEAKAKELSNLDSAEGSNKLTLEIQALDLELRNLENNVNITKDAIIADFYKVKGTNITKSDFDDFQNKIAKLDEAVGEMNARIGGQGIVEAMEEFKLANAYYKQFNDIANGLVSDDLRFKTYNSVFSNARTKNKDINDFTTEFLNKIQNGASYSKRPINETLNFEIDKFDGTFAPSRLLRKHIEVKLNNNEELSEKEQEIAKYIEEFNETTEDLIRRRELIGRKKELEAKLLEEPQGYEAQNEIYNDALTFEENLREKHEAELDEIQKKIDFYLSNIDENPGEKFDTTLIESDIKELEDKINNTDDAKLKKDLNNKLKSLKSEKRLQELFNKKLDTKLKHNDTYLDNLINLELEKESLIVNYNKEKDFNEIIKENNPYFDKYSNLTKEEQIELSFINMELRPTPTTMVEIEAENEILRNDIYRAVAGLNSNDLYEESGLIREQNELKLKLENTESDINNRLSQIESEIDILNKNKEDNLDDINALEEESKKLLSQIEDLKNPELVITRNIENSNKKYEESLTNINDLKSEKTEVSNKVSEIESEIKELDSKIQTLSENINEEDIQDVINSINDINLVLNANTLTEADREIYNELSTELEELKSKLDEYNKERANLKLLKDELSKLKSELSDVEGKIIDINIKIENLKNELNVEYDNYNNALKEKEENYTSSEIDSKITKIVNNTEAINSKLIDLEKSRKDYQFYVDKYTKTIEKLESDIKTLEDVVNSKAKVKDDLKILYKEFIQLLRNGENTDVIRAEIREKETFITDTTVEDNIADLKLKKERLQSELDKYQLRVDFLNKKIYNLEYYLNKNEYDLKELEKKKSKLDSVSYEVELVEKELSAIDEQIQLLNKEQNEIESNIDDLNNESNELKELLDNRNSYLDRFDYIENRLDKIQEAVNSASRTLDSLRNLDKYYMSSVDYDIQLTNEEEEMVNSLIDSLKENNYLLRNMKRPSLDKSLSLNEQIRTFIEANPIFANEDSPFYKAVLNGTMITTDEMNELESLLEKSDKTDEEIERVVELYKLAGDTFIIDNLEYEGVTLGDLLRVKKQSEELELQGASNDVEVNESIFKESSNDIQKSADYAFSSNMVSLAFDNAVSATTFHNGVEVKTISNLSLTNVLDRYFKLNPTATISLEINNSTGKVKFEDINIDNFEEYGNRYDTSSGLTIELENGQKLTKPKRTSAITGSPLGYSGSLEDFGLFRISVTGQKSKFDTLYEVNSQGGKTAVKSDFAVTVNGVELEFDYSEMAKIEKDDIVELVHLPEADYSKVVKNDKNTSVIVIRKNGKNIGVLKASDSSNVIDYADLIAIREAVVDNGKAKIKISESYLGLPNVEFDENGNFVTYDVTDSNEIGYINEKGENVFLNGGLKTNVNTDFMEVHRNKGVITPFVMVKHGKTKYAVPMMVKNDSLDVTEDLDNILNNNLKSDGVKILEINELLSKHKMYNADNMVNMTNFQDPQHLEKIRTELTNAEKIVLLTDHYALRNAEKVTMINPKNPFNASKFKLDKKVQGVRAKNQTKTQKTNNVTATQGKANSENNLCNII